MRFSSALTALALVPFACANNYPFIDYCLSSPDESIQACFLPIGAAVTEFWVKDKNGQKRDIVAGYDNRTLYSKDPLHPNFNQIVGRYANRIKNGTFVIGNENYRVDLNDNDGLGTLHGGSYGWSWRPWAVLANDKHSITFGLYDSEGLMGFPGNVNVNVTYTLNIGGKWHIKACATADKPTPLMLSSHGYWNLNAFKGSARTGPIRDNSSNPTIFDHLLTMPDVDQVVATDGILIPTGDFIDVQETAYDFTTEEFIGARLNQTEEYCGTGCTGYDTCFNRKKSYDQSSLAVQLRSKESGIRLRIYTDQQAIQFYSGNQLDGSIARKKSQGGPDAYYEQYSTGVLEMQGVIDAINNPQWGIDQIHGPDRPYSWESTYVFDVFTG